MSQLWKMCGRKEWRDSNGGEERLYYKDGSTGMPRCEEKDVVRVVFLSLMQYCISYRGMCQCFFCDSG